MAQERLQGLALLCIESELAKTIDYDSIIATFASRKDRKAACTVSLCRVCMVTSPIRYDSLNIMPLNSP